MANKFTKSVLERQAKERRLQPQEHPAAPTPLTETSPKPAAQTPTKPEKTLPLEDSPFPDLAGLISHSEGRKAKNKTFYLDTSVIEAIHKAAVSQKVTESKLVNDILKKILGV